MNTTQNNYIFDSKLSKFFDTPEFRQLISRYRAPSISPLIDSQIEINKQYQGKARQQEEIDEWEILEERNISRNNILDENNYFGSEIIDCNYDSLFEMALNHIKQQIDEEIK